VDEIAVQARGDELGRVADSAIRRHWQFPRRCEHEARFHCRAPFSPWPIRRNRHRHAAAETRHLRDGRNVLQRCFERRHTLTWGGRNGINDQQTRCTIGEIGKIGSVYSLRRSCSSVRFGGSFSDRVRVTVHGPDAFTLRTRADLGTVDRLFRYCGPKAQL